MAEQYMTTMPVPGQSPMVTAPLPGPDYETLLAQARLKMLNMGGSPGIPAPPAYDGPMNWSDTGLMGAGQAKADGNDSFSNLPPGLQRIFDRLPPDLQERLKGVLQNRAGGFQSEGGGGGRNADTIFAAGRQATGAPGQADAPSSGSGIPGFGNRPLGDNWRKGAAVVGAINPFAGLLAEAGRRANNVSYANSQRDMLGIPRPGIFGDFFTGGGKGSGLDPIGRVDIAGRSTGVSYGGIDRAGRTTYTPEEARRRRAAQNYGGYRGGDEGGGGRSTAGVGEGGWGSEEDRTSNPGGMGGY